MTTTADLSTTLAFKEFKYLNSYDVNYDVQIAICRLELPADITVDSSDVPQEVFLTAHILSNQMGLHDVSMSTHHAVPDRFHNSLIWDTVLYFPIKFRDLSLNSMLVFTAWSPDGRPYGGTSMHFFDGSGSLKIGKQKLIFFFDRRAENHVCSATPGELYDLYAPFDDNFIKEKNLEKYKNTVAMSHQIASGPRVGSGAAGNQSANMDLMLDWLDRLVLAQAQSSIAVSRHQHISSPRDNASVVDATGGAGGGVDVRGEESSGSRVVLSPEMQDLYSYCCLVVDMPMFPHPVLHEEKLYPSVTPHLPDVAFQMLTVSGGMGPRTTYTTDRGEPVYEFNLIGKQFSGEAFRHIVDWDMEAENPCEDLYRRLAHDTIRRGGAGDTTVKPNLQEKERLDKILRTPAPGDHMRAEDKDLMYRFRYVLTDNKMALSKFLLSVDWSSESEVAELPTLLELWKRNAPVDVSEALKLLSGGKAFQSPLVRRYAVDVLRNASDDELLLLLLQLVQALRYEPSEGGSASAGEGGRDDEDDEDVLLLSPEDVQGANHGEEAVEGKGALARSTSKGVGGLASLTPLGAFLVERACASTAVANFFHWYLKVETEDSAKGNMFQNVFDVFMAELKMAGLAGNLMEQKLRAQTEYIDIISSCQRAARDEKGRKDQKEATMRKLLAEGSRRNIPNGLDSVPLALEPSFDVTGLDPTNIILFKSAMYPAVIDFFIRKRMGQDPLHVCAVTSSASSHVTPMASNSPGVDAGGDESGEGVAVKRKGPVDESPTKDPADDTSHRHHRPSVEPVPETSVYKVIFKSGDDLRQDQLIMQLISLMDGLLKKVNLDLGLLTYGILATGPTDGVMEFVRGSMPISAVLSSFGNSILAYLKHHNPDSRGPLGVKAQAMDMFVRSCASSCVVTYILGIGDRHLDNVMIRTNGQLFHIDFGFIFGRDPKPLPPPFRFTRQMADAMGGEDSEHYKRFKAYCCQAYNWLRKSANLILNLLSLMVDAGIPDLSVNQEPNVVLKKVEQKFRLDLTDELAEVFFLGLINDSLTALAPRLMELAHQISVARR